MTNRVTWVVGLTLGLAAGVIVMFGCGGSGPSGGLPHATAGGGGADVEPPGIRKGVTVAVWGNDLSDDFEVIEVRGQWVLGKSQGLGERWYNFGTLTMYVVVQ